MTRQRAYRLRALIEKVIEHLEDAEALEAIELHPSWEANTTYEAGYKVRYNDILYTCLQAHTSQAGWEPAIATSLWTRVLIPDPDVVPVWVQPDSTNPYMIGDKVHYPTIEDPIYQSTIDNNVWAPDVYGWTLVN